MTKRNRDDGDLFEYDYYIKPDYLLQFLVSHYSSHICLNFQSLIAANMYNDYFKALDTHQKIESFVQFIYHSIFQSNLADQIYKDKYFGKYLIECFGKIIGNEMIMANEGEHYIFYRVVSENIIAYEFNTLMLRIFAETEEYWNLGCSDNETAVPLICTQSILEDEYTKSNIKDIMQEFKNVETVFEKFEFSDILLSVNNCIVPEKDSGDFFHMEKYQMEAPPYAFNKGYHIYPQWKKTISKFVNDFFGLRSEIIIDNLLNDIESIYNKNQHKVENSSFTPFSYKKGHLLQICIPQDIVDQFVYTSVYYGYPTSVYELEDGEHIANSPFKKPPLGVVRELTLHEIMNSPDMANLQSRILAHPNLFLCHGAFTNIVSANPLFDRKKFQNDLLGLFKPMIDMAKIQGKHLDFKKFVLLD